MPKKNNRAEQETKIKTSLLYASKPPGVWCTKGLFGKMPVGECHHRNHSSHHIISDKFKTPLGEQNTHPSLRRIEKPSDSKLNSQICTTDFHRSSDARACYVTARTSHNLHKALSQDDRWLTISNAEPHRKANFSQPGQPTTLILQARTQCLVIARKSLDTGISQDDGQLQSSCTRRLLGPRQSR